MRSHFGLPAALLLVTSIAGAQIPAGHPPVGAARASTSAAAAPSNVPSAAPPASAALPPGHPATPPPDADDGVFRPPPDEQDVDEKLAPGVIVVQIRDGANNVMPDVDVMLGILQQSVAKGDSRKHVNLRTDRGGLVRFDALDGGSGIVASSPDANDRRRSGSSVGRDQRATIGGDGE